MSNKYKKEHGFFKIATGRLAAATLMLLLVCGCGGGGAGSGSGSNSGGRGASPSEGTELSVVRVGPGTTDPSTHQLVRSSTNVLYVIAPDGQNFPSNPNALLRVWKANVAGAPTAFSPQDDAHAPASGVISSGIAIDGEDHIHCVWLDSLGNVNYAVFDAITNRWGTVNTLTSGAPPGVGQGFQGIALALDSLGNPHVVWNEDIGFGVQRLSYATREQGVWRPVFPVEDIATSSSWHPAMAFSPNGNLTIAWLDGDGSAYGNTGVVRTRVRRSDGNWDASEVFDDWPLVNLDNSPSLLIDSNGVRHITFTALAGGVWGAMRYWYDAGAGWRGDRQPPLISSHDPALGPDGYGGIYLYAHGEVDGSSAGSAAGLGHGKWSMHKSANATSWEPFTQIIAEGSGKIPAGTGIDDATNARWSQFFHIQPKTLDFAFWTYSPDAASGYTIYIGTQTMP